MMTQLIVLVVLALALTFGAWVCVRAMQFGIIRLRTAWAHATPDRRTKATVGALGGALLAAIVWGTVIWAIVSKAPWR